MKFVEDGALDREVSRQVEILSARADTLISKDELALKIRRSLASGQPLKVKLGVDPSAPDLHLGHVVVMKKLREFQELGHEIYFVIGDFTGMIGDPSGKSETRPQLTEEEVRENAETYRQQATAILDPAKTHMVYNSQWLSPMTFADVVKLGARFTVARMLERDDFQKRYESGQPIGIHEFLYPLAQAYDSVAIGADVELGGTDQTFNLLVGRNIQKEFSQESQVILTMPLLVGLDGTLKMSKSLGNYIGVKDAPADMFGKIMSIPDELILTYSELVLAMDEEFLRKLKSDLETQKVHPMDAKMDLAQKIVSEFLGANAGNFAKEEFIRVFRQGQLPQDILEFTPSEMGEEDEMGLAKLLSVSGLVKSSSEARRLIKSGAVRVNGTKMQDESGTVKVQDGMLLQVGKRRILRISL